MKKIVVLSGKGGTGKTFITSNFAYLASDAAVVDADVDAANLDILFQSENIKSSLFESGYEAVIDQDKCTQCGICRDNCRFSAVKKTRGSYRINHISCEGCGVCSLVCPAGAVTLDRKVCGCQFLSETREFPFFHAELFPPRRKWME